MFKLSNIWTYSACIHNNYGLYAIILIILQVSTGAKVAAEGILIGSLGLMVKEQVTGEVECFIVAEQQVLMKVTGLEAPLLLLMLSYCLDTTYPDGTKSMYSFLEVALLGMKPKKVASIVDRMITCLK
jgi:hypothetical protein